MAENPTLLSIMRAMGTAWRSLRLYPPNSPMPLEAAKAVCEAVEEYLQAEPSLRLDVVRGGFILRGLDGLLTAPGVSDIADAFALHGVGEVHFVAPPTPEGIITLLSSAQLQHHELQELGGMQKALAAADVDEIRVVAVVLQKVEAPPEIPEDEADRFFAELAADAARLAVWLRSLLAFDDEGLIEGITTLAEAASDLPSFGRTLATAFFELDQEGKDRLLESWIELEPLHDVAVAMLGNVLPIELVAALRGGRFGQNPLSLSYAITALPVPYDLGPLRAEACEALRSGDATEPQIQLLDRLIGLRLAGEPEPDITDSIPALLFDRAESTMTAEQFEAARALARQRTTLDAKTIGVLLGLLDAAADLRTYSRVLEALARAVPHLFELGEPDLAMWTLREFTRRVREATHPWPELEERLVAARDVACGPASTGALLALSADNPRALDYAKELVSLGEDRAARGMAVAALASEDEQSMHFAEAVLGRRLPELLAPEAATVDARHVARLTQLFAGDGGPWCMQAIAHFIARPEDRVRAETAKGLAAAGGKAMLTYMPALLSDSSEAVSRMAVHMLGKVDGDAAAKLLGNRLQAMDSDRELPLAREIVGVLVNSPSPAAGAALAALAEKGALLGRGKRAELRSLAADALAARRSKGL